MLLCDIGNSFAHCYDGENVWRILHDDLERYRNERVCYVNVKRDLKEELAKFSKWIDLEPFIDIATSYEGLGADRKMLCYGVENGVVVDAGSAITVDVMEEGRHLGGYIYPGIFALQRCFATISPALDHPFVWDLEREKLPTNTAAAISYGAIVPLVEHIASFEKRIYLTGGDGKILRKFLPHAIYDEKLIFKGMEKLIQRKKLC